MTKTQNITSNVITVPNIAISQPFKFTADYTNTTQCSQCNHFDFNPSSLVSLSYAKNTIGFQFTTYMHFALVRFLLTNACSLFSLAFYSQNACILLSSDFYSVHNCTHLFSLPVYSQKTRRLRAPTLTIGKSVRLFVWLARVPPRACYYYTCASRA